MKRVWKEGIAHPPQPLWDAPIEEEMSEQKVQIVWVIC
jgi:hypothetical protein